MLRLTRGVQDVEPEFDDIFQASEKVIGCSIWQKVIYQLGQGHDKPFVRSMMTSRNLRVHIAYSMKCQFMGDRYISMSVSKWTNNTLKFIFRPYNGSQHMARRIRL